MHIRYYLDPETLEPHIHLHGVTEAEVAEALANPIEEGGGAEQARIVIGRTDGGRILRVIYVADPERDSGFVITAYQLGPKALRALRRRMRKRA